MEHQGFGPWTSRVSDERSNQAELMFRVIDVGFGPTTSRMSRGRSNQTELIDRVEKKGLEPSTSCLQGRRTPKLCYIPESR